MVFVEVMLCQKQVGSFDFLFFKIEWKYFLILETYRQLSLAIRRRHREIRLKVLKTV